MYKRYNLIFLSLKICNSLHLVKVGLEARRRGLFIGLSIKIIIVTLKVESNLIKEFLQFLTWHCCQLWHSIYMLSNKNQRESHCQKLMQVLLRGRRWLVCLQSYRGNQVIRVYYLFSWLQEENKSIVFFLQIEKEVTIMNCNPSIEINIGKLTFHPNVWQKTIL